ncbi:MAG: TonB-dependent receptor plug domain-containing protein [Pseudohongiella sp.]|nr:TonB-dependent receptor plug domain-containing protein [Pseudohongiella sp.]
MSHTRLILSGTTALCLSIALTTAQAQAPESDSTVTYGADFFSEFGALTVNDMLDRVPGIEMILQAGGASSVSSDGNRGLGASAQILIDGKRMAGKANEARAQLARIPARQVARIEIIRGSSSDLDVQNSGQIVNIVLLEALASSSLATEINATHYHDGTLRPGGSMALSGQNGRLNYVVSGQAASAYEHLESFETSVLGNFSPNDTIAIERYRDQMNYSFNSNLTFAITENDRLAFNALYGEQDPPVTLYRNIVDYVPATPITYYEREDIPASAANWEIGGDYERRFGNGSRLKFLYIANQRTNNTTRERYRSTTPADIGNKLLFLDTSSRYQEKIARSSYTFNLSASQGVEIGFERAQTTQYSGLRQGVRTAAPGDPAYGGLTPLVLPNAFSVVEEIRYEPFAVHNWQINPRMTLESSLVAEYSEIEQTGDVSRTRDFNFIKPKLDFRFDINSTLQLKASLEQFISQLTFADFSRSVNERDDDQDTVAGNPDLNPEESIRAEISLDYRLPADAGTLNTRFFYYDFDNKIGKIDISPSINNLQSTNGNVGPAAAYGLISNASLRLGFIGLPRGLLTAALTVQESKLHHDPFVGFTHRFPPYDRSSLRVGYRHDLPEYNLSYGVTYNARAHDGRFVYEIDNRFTWIIPTNLSAFVEMVGFGGLTYRLEGSNLADFEACSQRRRFDGYLRDGVIKEIERNCSVTGSQFAFKVRGTF